MGAFTLRLEPDIAGGEESGGCINCLVPQVTLGTRLVGAINSRSLATSPGSLSGSQSGRAERMQSRKDEMQRCRQAYSRW